MASKFIRFEQVKDMGTTKEWEVVSVRDNGPLGCIEWNYGWRQYVFRPDLETEWSWDCLQSIVDFLKEQNRLHREQKAEEAKA